MRKLYLIILLICASCARPPQSVWQQLPSAEQLLARVQATQGHFRSLDAEARVRLDAAGQVHSSQQFLLLERPNRVRSDLLTGFGQLVLQLASDGRELAVFVNTEAPGKFFRGPASDANLARFTRIPLPAESLVQLLLYDPPLVNALQSKVQVQEDQLLLMLDGPERRQELWFDDQLQLVASRYFSGDELLLDVRYAKLAEDGFPREMSINLAREQIRVRLRFSDVRINGIIAEEKFVLRPADGLLVEPLP
jgi:outer membrane lipoprotein-sorting protein